MKIKSDAKTYAKLGSILESNKQLFETVFQELLKHNAGKFYVSLLAESRKKKSFSINNRSTDLDEDQTAGVVLRAFDGETLFESAFSDFNLDKLIFGAKELIEKVIALKGIQKKGNTYRSPNWSDRLKMKLDPEILNQIPNSADNTTWVNFGIQIHEKLFSNETETMGWLKTNFDKLISKSKFLNIDFTKIGLSLGTEEFLFIDESVKMTQVLPRNLLRLVLVKGEDSSRVDLGGLGGRECISLQEDHFNLVIKKLEDLIKAERLKPGRYPVLMGPAITGVFAHEAFGHTQEGDTWARGRSKAKELFESQTRVGNDNATILNNPAIYKNGTEISAAWGSYFFDEEGWLAQEQVLVDKGFLKTPMTNLSSSVRLKVDRTANGKREDWSHGVYTRQTNTYFSAGDKTLDEIFPLIKYGFLAEECSGGMEDPKGMGIQVSIQYLEEVKDGKKTGRTFKGPNGGTVQMTGYVPDYLNKIIVKSKVDAFGEAKDSEHPWNDTGGCGKYHKEFVYAGCGGPYMLVDDVLLG